MKGEKDPVTITSYPEKNLSRKKIKGPLALKIIRWTYPKFERIAPRYAYRWFVKLFFTPVRYKIPDHEKAILRQAEVFSFPLRNRNIQVYSWGAGPVILLVHGWAGRASQFKYFIERLSAQGFRTVAFDALGHGLSEGKETSIIDFKDAILEIQKRAGDIGAIIAHSLGGAASLFAMSEGLPVHTVVTIATPTIGDEIINEFAIRLNATVHSKLALVQSVEQKLNRPFDSFMASYFIKQLGRDIRLLVIHDEQDKEASFRNAEVLQAVYPKAKLVKTTGLGHTRILRNDAVIALCLDFVRGKR